MRGKYRPHHILEVVLLCIALAGFSESNSKANENTKYLDAVREFADNVLKYGRDTYGPKHTPLFVDGLNIHTHEPVEWIAPNGDRWILSNLASQQNLFRTLDGLSRITGDPKYKQAAVEALKYVFDHLRTPNGLLHWGGHQAYDVAADKPCGRGIHELKGFYPYYQLMWEVDPQATKRFIEAFWSAHILDWSNLNMDRHCYAMNAPLEKPWKHEYEGGPVFLESDSGTSFIHAGTDLICAAAWLTKLSGEKTPLVWAKRLARRYVDTRNPETGINYGLYTKPPFKVRESYDDIMRKLVPGTTEFITGYFLWTANPIARKCTLGYSMPTPGISVNSNFFYWQSQFLVAEMLGSEGDEFKQWTLEELTALGKATYRKKNNVYVPILTDGTNLEGYVVKADGPLGPKGVALESVPAGPSDLWVYTMGYSVTEDVFMWEMARGIARGNGFGDIGATSKDRPELDFGTDCSDPYAILAFLELHRETAKNEFLAMARKIGDNILRNRFYKGFFVASNKHIYTKFDAIDTLVLLHLYSTCAEDNVVIPHVWPSVPFFETLYRKKDIVIDNQIIYTLTESSEPPMSLQEAAAIGDIGLVRSLIEEGIGVDTIEDSFYKTALHRAAIEGYKSIAELLLAEGADVNAENESGGTPLHYAAEKGHKEIAELLIAKGADVNARNSAGNTPLHYAARSRDVGQDIIELLIAKSADVNAKDDDGQTPLHYAVEYGHKDVVELLIVSGADLNVKNKDGNAPGHVALGKNNSAILDLLIAKGVDVSSIHLAAYLGDAAKVVNFIEQGSDVNTKNQGGLTPLHYAARRGHKEIVEVLLAHGADVNSEGRGNRTAAEFAMGSNHREIVQLLVSKGADISPLHIALYMEDQAKAKSLIEAGVDINKRTPYGTTSLHRAVSAGFNDLAVQLIAKGADVNAKDNWNWTPLHSAAYYGNKDMVEMLIVKGADVTARDGGGRTPLWHAQDKGHAEIAELLRKHGAKE